MDTKTPISLLQEICVKYLFTVPKYELTINGEQNMFEYAVSASTYRANGVASSKQIAKQKAAKNLLDQWSKLDKFKAILNEIPVEPQLEKNNNCIDAVSNLLEICAKQNWDMPIFNYKGSTGPSNAPLFTTMCTFKGYCAEGCARTKKDAKKIAAKSMTDQIADLIVKSESDLSPSPEEQKQYTIDEILSKFRKHQKWNQTRQTDILSHRHFYFEKFPADQKNEAKKILQMADSHREIVHAFCKVLNIEYQVCDVPKRPQYKSFELLVMNFDCIIVNKDPEIWTNIVDYFKVMMCAC